MFVLQSPQIKNIMKCVFIKNGLGPLTIDTLGSGNIDSFTPEKTAYKNNYFLHPVVCYFTSTFYHLKNNSPNG